MVETFVEIQALRKNYGTHAAIQNISLSVKEGEIVGLLGPNGAGKTTLIGCLLGFLLPSAGTVRLFGEDTTALLPNTRMRLGFVPQTMGGFSWFKVGELIDYIGKFYNQPPGDVPEWLLDWAGLNLSQRVKGLSGGQKQRLAILLALRHSPDLLVLDEPVASLDPQARRDFMELIARFCNETGKSAIISSHILSDLEKISTRAVFMRGGVIVYDTPMENFRTAMRWVSAPPAAMPEQLKVLAARADGALLVDGWDESLAAQVEQQAQAPVIVQKPDLEEAFLEMTR